MDQPPSVDDDVSDFVRCIAERARTFKPVLPGDSQPQSKAKPRHDRQPTGESVDDVQNARSDERARPASEDTRADVAILTALQSPELKQVLDAFGPSWEREVRQGVNYHTQVATLSGVEARIVAATQVDMGMVPSTILAMKTIFAWRPKLLAMVGICAGVKGKVSLGDVVVGKEVFDYGSGKLDNGAFIPDYKPATLNEQADSYLTPLATDETELARIRADWPGTESKPKSALQVHVGAMASGAAVVADGHVVTEVGQNKRSLLAIDMEAFGVMRAAVASVSPPIAIVVKGVQDFADEKKNDTYRDYAAFVSARFLARFLSHCWQDLVAVHQTR